MTVGGKRQQVKVRDILQRKTVTDSKFCTYNYSAIYADRKRQCNKKEIKWIEAQIEAKLSK